MYEDDLGYTTMRYMHFDFGSIEELGLSTYELFSIFWLDTGANG